MSQPPLRTVGRALDLLATVERAGRPMTLTELAAAMDESAPVVHRLLRTLEAAGRLTRPGGGKRYALPPASDPLHGARAALRLLRALSLTPAAARTLGAGAGIAEAEAEALLAVLGAEGLAEAGPDGWTLSPGLLALARPLLASDLAARLRPAMERLRDATGETVGLLVRTGHAQVLTAMVPSREQLRFAPSLGDTWPLDRGAGGKAQLMALPDAEVRAILAALPEPRDPEALLTDLAQARARGWAQTVGERLPDVGAVAAPAPGIPGAVVTLIFPAFRVPEPRRAEFGRALVAELAALA